jgi:hypothetical protein
VIYITSVPNGITGTRMYYLDSAIVNSIVCLGKCRCLSAAA